MKFSIFDTIQAGQKSEQEKPWTEIVENEEFNKRHHKS